jgi:hypothetical protein
MTLSWQGSPCDIQFQRWHGINYLFTRTYRLKPGVVDGEDPELLKSGQALLGPSQSLFGDCDGANLEN